MTLPKSIRPHTRGIFYGWYVVLGGFCIQLLNGGLLFYAFSAYILPLQAEFGWSRAALSGAFSMARAESGILGPLQGWLIDRYGPRRIMSIGNMLFGAGFILFSRMDSLTTFYLSFAFIALGSSLGGFMPIATTVTNWFARRRATALGLSLTGMGVGGLLIPLVVWCLSTYGWRPTAFVSGLLILAIGVPASQLMRHRPEDYGLLPDGDPPPTPETAAAAHKRSGERPGAAQADGKHATAAASARAAGTGRLSSPAERAPRPPTREPLFTTRQALRTPAFWLLSTAHACVLLAVGAVMVHQVPHMVERIGMTPQMAAANVALLVCVNITAQVLGGYVGDRLDKRLLMFGCMWLHAIALVVFAFATTRTEAVIFAVLHGAAWGVRGILINAIRADYFGRAAYASVTGFNSLISMIGMMGGPLLSGLLHDTAGDYQTAFLIMASLSAVGSLAMFLARKPGAPGK